MNDLVERKRQFLEYLAIERGRGTKTIENYDRYLERFFAFVKVKTVSELTEKQIQEFRSYLSHQPGTKIGVRVEPMKQKTQNYHLIALRAFFAFLQKCGVETLSPAQISLAQVHDHSPATITFVELKRLIVAPNQKTIEGKRDRAIIQILFSTGLRISELCSLSVSDIDLTCDKFLVRGKGGNVRIVGLSKIAKKYLTEYLSARKDLNDALFVRYGRKAQDGGDLRLHPRAVQRLIKFYAGEVGITHKVTPHVIRHSFAKDLLSNGADLRSVQSLLGHTHISSTRVYTHVHKVHKKLEGKQE